MLYNDLNKADLERGARRRKWDTPPGGGVRNVGMQTNNTAHRVPLTHHGSKLAIP
ncbi:hypothetical protein ACSS6W_007655 [Trichoderma asperelloides]